MRAVTVLTLALALPHASLAAKVPPPHTVIVGAQAAKWQRYVAQSHLPTPPITLRIVIGRTCPYKVVRPLAACTKRGERVLFLRPSTTRSDFYHELGHQFDYWSLTPSERQTFRRLLGDQRGWISPPNSPHEQFAEAYRIGALGPPYPQTVSGQNPDGSYTYAVNGAYLYQPPLSVHEQIIALIREWGSH